MTSTSLVHKNITTTEQINFQRAKIIVIYFLCNPSVTKQHNASDTTQNMAHWQNKNIQRFALLRSTVLYTVSKQTAASASKHVREVLVVLANPPGKRSTKLLGYWTRPPGPWCYVLVLSNPWTKLVQCDFSLILQLWWFLGGVKMRSSE